MAMLESSSPENKSLAIFDSDDVYRLQSGGNIRGLRASNLVLEGLWSRPTGEGVVAMRVPSPANHSQLSRACKPSSVQEPIVIGPHSAQSIDSYQAV